MLCFPEYKRNEDYQFQLQMIRGQFRCPEESMEKDQLQWTSRRRGPVSPSQEGSMEREQRWASRSPEESTVKEAFLCAPCPSQVASTVDPNNASNVISTRQSLLQNLYNTSVIGGQPITSYFWVVAFFEMKDGNIFFESAMLQNTHSPSVYFLRSLT